MAKRGRPRKDQSTPQPIDGGADAPQEQSNSAARADTIRAAARWLAGMEAEVKALRAEINEYKQTHIKGDLGFKLADWNMLYRLYSLEGDDRDKLLDTIREGFKALGVGEQLDWIAAANQQPAPRADNPKGDGHTASATGAGNGKVADPDPIAHQTGFADGLAGNIDHAARWPAGELGHADYHLGHAEGEKQHERAAALAP